MNNRVHYILYVFPPIILYSMVRHKNHVCPTRSPLLVSCALLFVDQCSINVWDLEVCELMTSSRHERYCVAYTALIRVTWCNLMNLFILLYLNVKLCTYRKLKLLKLIIYDLSATQTLEIEDKIAAVNY